jgi:hypothetical protein
VNFSISSHGVHICHTALPVNAEKITAVYSEDHTKYKKKYSVDGMQRYRLLQQAVHILTSGL